jgi:hypothetical protein
MEDIRQWVVKATVGGSCRRSASYDSLHSTLNVQLEPRQSVGYDCRMGIAVGPTLPRVVVLG